MKFLETEDDLNTLYPAANPLSIDKVMPVITPLYRNWIMASRFCVLATYAQGRVDLSPRGDDGPVALVLDPKHIALPDWRGNNRLDSLRNIMRDGAVSIMFMAHGSDTAVRVIGRAKITADPDMCQRFQKDRHLPKTVMIIEVDEVYCQCARPILRSDLWAGAAVEGLPTLGELLVEAKNGDFDGVTYDANWSARVNETLWGDS